MTENNTIDTTDSNDIAIVGMGFRFPKSSSPDEFWNKMSNKFDGISKIPTERWSSNFYDQDYINNEYGGILEEEEWKRFDPLFFGISPKEAPTLDPQQRLLMTTLWEAFEDSQIKPSSIRGSDTGVFIGMMNLDYQRCQFRDISTVSPYTVTGNASSFISNRLSFAFDLRGPSMTIDTACSSSLNAVYLGCQAITTGDCKMAVVGGVNGIFDPTISMTFSGFGMLGHKGQCRSFDAGADGFIRGEGAGVCILKKYSDAVADGDRIYCVIKGGHSNVDGYNKKTNITAPSMQAQSENIEIALRKSKVSPEDVYYIEAHGTGTPVGDPIEIEALSKVFKSNHSPSSPLFIGSVKSNMGHLESAAGIASIIKVGLMLKHRSLMPNIHFDKPNPLINFEDWNIRVVTNEIKFPSNKRVTMGVNSFGLSGSNCHMILSEAPINLQSTTTTTTTVNKTEYLIPFSANSKLSLDKYIEHINSSDDYFKSNISFKEFVMHQSISKSNLVKRKVITASDWDDFKTKRNEVTTSSTLTSTISTPQSSTPLIFVFVGQGPQWKGMLDKLYTSEPIFKETVDKCDLLLSNYFGYSIFNRLKSLESDESPELHHPQLAQPSIFLVQVALVELYKSYNINPSIVVGHSFGEVTSALYSGIIDLETAVKIVYHRSTLQNLTIGTGRLLSIGVGQQGYLDKIKGTSFNDDIEIACFNDPNSIVITGTEDRLKQVKELLSADGIFCAFLGTPCSFHSSKQESIKEKVFNALADLPETSSPSIPFFSTITGEQMTGKGFYNAQYIYDNLRNPVDFTKAISNIYRYIEQHDMKNAIFVEIGPHPTLGFYIPKCKSSDSTITTPTLIVSPLHKKKEEIQQFKLAISTLYCNGVEVDFGNGQFTAEERSSFPSFKESTSILPRYQWDSECYWEEPNASKLVKRGPTTNVLGHDQFSGNRLFELFIDIKKPAYQYLKGHKIKGKYLFPGSGYIDNILRCYQGQDITLYNLEFSNPFFLTEGIQHHLQTTFTSLTKGGEQKVEFFIKDNRDAMKWTKTSNGRIGTFPHRYKNNNSLKKDVEAIKSKCNFTTLTKSQVYSKLLLLGLPYGPTFQRVESTLLGDGCSFSKISMTSTSVLDNEQDHFFNPSIIDCCLHGLLSLSDGPQEIIFDRLEDLKYYSSNVPLRRPEFIYVYAQFTKIIGNSTQGSIDIMLEDGTLLISIKQVKCTSLIRLKKSSTIKYPSKDVYSHHWQLKNSQLLSPFENQSITNVKSSDDSSSNDINNLLNNQLFNQYLIGLLNKSITSEFNSFDLNNSTIEQLSIDTKNKELFENVKSILQQTTSTTTGPSSLDTIKSQLVETFSSFKKEIYLVEKSIKRIVNTLKGGADTEHLSPSNPSSPLESPRKSIVNSHGDSSADSQDGDDVEVTATTATSITNEPFNFSNSKFLKCKNLTIVNLVSNLLNPLVTSTTTTSISKKLVKIIQIFDNQNVNLPQLILTNLKNQFRAQPKLIKNLEIEFTILISSTSNSKSIELIKQLTKQYQIESNGILNIKYRTIELQDDLEEQGLLLSNYDLVISSFLFYSTLDVNALLVKLYKLLLPLGQLVMLEPPQNVLAYNLLFANTNVTTRSIDQFKSTIQFSGFTKIAHSTTDGNDQGLIIIQSQKREIESMSMTFSSNSESLNTSYTNIVFIASTNQIELKPKYLEEYFDITEIFGDNTKIINGDTLESNQDDQLFISSLGDNDIVFFISSLDTLTTDNYQSVTMQYTLVNQILLKNSLSSRFVLLTNQSQNSGINYLGSSLVGTYRYFLEFPSLNIYSVDVDNESIENLTLFLRVVDPLTIGDREIVIRSNQVLVQRIFKESSLLEPSENYEKDSNSLYLNTNSNLEFQFKCKPLELPNDYVEIKVMATGINYKDNLYFRGLLPPDLFLVGDVYNPPFGLECSGIVTRVGSSVSRFKQGDQVVGFASHSLSSHAITTQDKLVLKPSNVSFTDAAAVCVVYATSYYAIFHIGAFMHDKESILIHSATGGVGLATLNLLKWKRSQQQTTGNEEVPPIYVTVGSDEKVEYLKSKYGSLITNIFNSRDTEFSSEIKSQSDGVDLILNTLSGDYLSANFRSLSQLGRIMDLSVTQLVDNDSLDFGNFKFHIGYQTIDLERASKYNSKVVRDILTNVFSAIGDGSLENIPVKVFPCTQVKNAIEFINERIHIGKIVVDFSNFENDILKPAISEPLIINNPILSNQVLKSNFTCSNQLTNTILVTGQTGIAVHIIKWIISGYNNASGTNGIDFIILSRSSLKWELEYLINSTRSQYGNKFRFHYKSVDISKLDETRNSINEIYSGDKTVGPIKSVFHFATVYEYVLPEDINLSVISNTHGPKAIGAINLHNLSIELDWKLNHFIMFSSIGAIIGGSKQSAYASANLVLDSLANYRKSIGLSACSINWGGLDAGGVVATDKSVFEFLKGQGILLVSLPKILGGLDACFQSSNSTISNFMLSRFNTDTLLSVAPQMKRKMEHHLTTYKSKSSDANNSNGSNGVDSVQEKLVNIISELLSIHPTKLNMDTRLKDYGIDSLVTVQLKSFIDREFAKNLFTHLQLSSNSINSIIQRINSKK